MHFAAKYELGLIFVASQALKIRLNAANSHSQTSNFLLFAPNRLNMKD